VRDRKEFKVSFKGFWLLCIPSAAVSLGLIGFGFNYYNKIRLIEESARKGGGTLPDSFPPDWIFYALPWTVAAVIAFLYLWVYMLESRRKIIVTPTHLEIVRGGDTTRTLWQNVSLTPPRSDKKSFRSALLSDGTHYETVYEFFYPEFQLLVDFVTDAKKHARESIST